MTSPKKEKAIINQGMTSKDITSFLLQPINSCGCFLMCGNHWFCDVGIQDQCIFNVLYDVIW